jgi:hypothetical protein
MIATRSPARAPGSACRYAAKARLDVRERDRGAEIRECGPIGEPDEARFEQRHERRIAVRIDLGRDARRVLGQPVLSRHRAA